MSTETTAPRVSEEERMRKIQALLAKAESTTFPDEAKAFTTKAQELMMRWAIDDAMLAGLDGEALGDIGETLIRIPQNEYISLKSTLASTVARYNSCRTFRSGPYSQYVKDEDGNLVRTKNGRYKRERWAYVHIYGYERDRKFVEQVWTSLLIQAENAFNSPVVQEQFLQDREDEWLKPQQYGGFRIKWHNTFMAGFVGGVSSQLYEASKRTKAEARETHGAGMDIVLVNREEAIDKAYKEAHPDLRTVRSSAGNGSYGASSAGRVAGRNADVGRPRVGGNRKALS